ncbi:MAG: heparan-alpha-glucosaminide N-acetyltransferase domain-containing protein [Cyclobacteriaceae bacterium]|nr:heparan-alpha-glucosaminide N-acetyltransferase domain-containing protein [Cyclobacteriaceae bacterium]
MKNSYSATDLAFENTPARYVSLDVLRGLTIALMVLVNNPGTWGSIYAPFRHADWHGFTLTDMVFPSFLFVVGNAMSFSLRKFQNQNDVRFLKKVFKRTIIIFLIGLFLNAYPFVKLTADGSLALKDFSAIRIFGVLQRIALCYGIASLVIHYFSKKGALIFSIATLLGYWAAMYYFGDATDPYSLEGNAAIKFDLLFISPVNLYKGEGIPFDPEGLLSTFPAVVNVIGGYFAGQFIQKNGNAKSTVIRLLYAGLGLIVLGLLWDILFPINKKIWTSSYVLLTIGLSTVAIGFLMYAIEIVELKRWTFFFEVFGKNPLVLFALSGVLVKTMALIKIQDMTLQPWIFNTFFLRVAGPKDASLLYAIFFIMVIWLVGYAMDRNKIYIKV